MKDKVIVSEKNVEAGFITWNIKPMKTNYKKIAQLTGLKVNHVKQVLKGNRKAKFKDLIDINFVITNLKDL